jgi:hypothetical protein
MIGFEQRLRSLQERAEFADEHSSKLLSAVPKLADCFPRFVSSQELFHTAHKNVSC